jgi:hypothetical protein
MNSFEQQPIENIPRIKGLKCKIYVYSIYFALVAGPLLVAIYIWLEFDLLIAIGTLIFLYLVSSIITSKLRLLSLPKDQYERSFTTLEIAKWYTSRNLCF